MRQRVVNNDRHWNIEMETIAYRIIQQATMYAWMYENMAINAKYWDTTLTIVSGVLGCMTGSAGLMTIVSLSDVPTWAQIVQSCLGFIITFITVFMSTWRLSEEQMNSMLTHVSYSQISKDLIWQLAQPRRDRQDAREYIKSKLSEVDQLKISAPIISKKIRDSYDLKNKKDPTYIPSQYEEKNNYIRNRNSLGISSEIDEKISDGEYDTPVGTHLDFINTLIVMYNETHKENEYTNSENYVKLTISEELLNTNNV